MKACKNSAELSSMRACHLRDGAAVVEALAAVDDMLGMKMQVTEIMLDEMLCHYRTSIAGMICPSFPTIAAINSNGAIVHYRATPKTCKATGETGMSLVS
jgi:Xaa-Pro aminopeptidase